MRAGQLYFLISSGDSTKLDFSKFPHGKNHLEGTLKKKKKKDWAPNQSDPPNQNHWERGPGNLHFSLLPGNQVTYDDQTWEPSDPGQNP